MEITAEMNQYRTKPLAAVQYITLAELETKLFFYEQFLVAGFGVLEKKT